MIAPERLAKTPSRLHRRRIARRLGILVSILAVPLGSYFMYRHVNWRGWLPNSVVLKFQNEVYLDAWDHEIGRRYWAGRFSAEQAARMFDTSIRTSFRDKTPDPYPVGIELPVRVRVYWYLAGVHWGDYDRELQWWRDDWTLSVDGKPAVILVAPDGPMPSREVEFDVADLSVGTHRITVSGRAWLTRKGSAGAAVKHSWLVSLSKTVRIEDRPVEEFARPIRSPQVAARFERRLTALGHAATHDHPRGCFRLLVDIGSVPIAAEVWTRPSGAGPYRRLSEARWFENSICTPLETRNWSSVEFPIGNLTVTHIDVRLMPSAEIALAGGMAQYADYVIEWIGLPLNPVKGEWHRPTTPTSVRPAHE